MKENMHPVRTDTQGVRGAQGSYLGRMGGAVPRGRGWVGMKLRGKVRLQPHPASSQVILESHGKATWRGL